jgi:RNA polymerase sigma factor (sigma-70 family)
MNDVTTTTWELERLLGEATWLRALARSLLHDGPDADDAVQEVWMAAMRAPPASAHAPRPWLAQVLRNVVRSAARRSRAQRAREDEEASQRGPRALPSAEGLLERMRAQRLVAEQVMALTEPYRSTLLLRFYGGRLAVEIARAQGLPAGTVRWRISEGLRRLRVRLDDVSGGERERWKLALAPLAEFGRFRGGPIWAWRLFGAHGLALGACAGVVVAALTIGALRLHAAGTSTSVRPASADAHDEGLRSPGRASEEDTRRERLRRAAVFFGVALPALTAAARQHASAAEDDALEDAVVAGCLAMQEKSYECKDAFVEATLDGQLAKAGGSLTADQRAQVHAARIEVKEREMARPLEVRRAGCKEMVEKMEPRAKDVADAKQSSLTACYARADCDERARCFVAVIDEVATELGAPTNPR